MLTFQLTSSVIMGDGDDVPPQGIVNRKDSCQQFLGIAFLARSLLYRHFEKPTQSAWNNIVSISSSLSLPRAFAVTGNSICDGR